MAEIKSLDTLQVWQKALAFAVKVQKEILPLLPQEEKWSLAIQLRRAVQSIVGNIAEGYGRFYFQEGVRFCYIARGSLEESFTYLALAEKLGYLPVNTFITIHNEVIELRRLINGYISFLKKSKLGLNEPGNYSRVQENSPLYDLEIPKTDSDE